MLASTVVVLAACDRDDGSGPVDPELAIVTMPGFSFTPFTTTIEVGDSVTYDFPADPPHNVIFARVTGAPADIQATTGRSVSRTFLVAGNYPYDCTLHPGMSGVVEVD